MEAAIESHLSTIKLNFGSHESASIPINLSFWLSFFSQEQKDIKASIENKIDIQLPKSCIVITFSTNSSTQQFATKLNESDTIKFVNESSPSEVKFVANGDKIYAIITGSALEQTIEGFEKEFQSLKNENQNQPHNLKINISSNNGFSKLSELIKVQGLWGLLNSSKIELQFIKNQFMSKFLVIFFEKILKTPEFVKLAHSFKKLNFELNCQGSAYLKQFSKITFEPFKPTPTTEFMRLLIEGAIQHANFYAFNPSVFLKGNLQLNELSELLSTLHI